MATYYELMVISRRGKWGDTRDHTEYEYNDEKDMDKRARNAELDSESQTVANAIGIIRYLLKNDESVKEKCTFKKRRK